MSRQNKACFGTRSTTSYGLRHKDENKIEVPIKTDKPIGEIKKYLFCYLIMPSVIMLKNL